MRLPNIRTMKILRYVFYRIYKFYQKKRPKESPEIIATAVVMLILIYCAIALSIIITLSMEYPLMKNAKVYLFPLFVIYMVLSYFLFLKDDKYKKYLVEADYKNKLYQGQNGNIVFSGVVIIPFILTVICIFLGQKN